MLRRKPRIYEELYNRSVTLVFLKEPHINTETYKQALEDNVALTGGTVDYILEGVNKYLMALAKEQIRLAFEQSEKEVLLNDVKIFPPDSHSSTTGYCPTAKNK